MPCNNPENIAQEITSGNSVFRFVLTHCNDQGCAELQYNFDPPNQGRRVKFKANLRCEGEGVKSFTKEVIFYDDGTVEKYGDIRNGVRFVMKNFDFHKHHELVPVVYFEPL